MTATSMPRERRKGTIARDSGLFPAPVRDAVTAMTGFEECSTWREPSSSKSAPAAFTREARCRTSWLDRSEYDSTHVSTPSCSISSSSRDSG